LVAFQRVSSSSERQYEVRSIGNGPPMGVVENRSWSIERFQSRSRSLTHCASAAFT
jgi:hypothetical protein